MSKLDTPITISELILIFDELLIPFTKVRRDMPSPADPAREENDAEHSYNLSLMAIFVAEGLNLGLDTGLVAKYALVHDLVEAHAGDISIRASERDLALKAERERKAYLYIEKLQKISAMDFRAD